MADIEYIENTPIIKTARDFLKSNKYKPFDTAYFVTLNDRDDCGEDFCLNCISNEVKRRRKEHKESRDKIKQDFESLITTGLWRGVKQQKQYTEVELRKEMRSRLKEFPVNAKFDYEGHDPDFGGGLTEPKICEGCGEYFDTYFVPKYGEMDYFEDWNKYSELDDKSKWILHRLIEWYGWYDAKLRVRVERLANKIILENKVKLLLPV